MPLNVVWRWGERGSPPVLGAPHSLHGQGRWLSLWPALAAASTDPTGAQQREAPPCPAHWAPVHSASQGLTVKLLTWTPAATAQRCYPEGLAALCREGSRTAAVLGDGQGCLISTWASEAPGKARLPYPCLCLHPARLTPAWGSIHCLPARGGCPCLPVTAPHRLGQPSPWARAFLHGWVVLGAEGLHPTLRPAVGQVPSAPK